MLQENIKDRWRNAKKAFDKGELIHTEGADVETNKNVIEPLLKRAVAKMEAEGVQSCE